MLAYFAELQISTVRPTEGHELELPCSSAGLGTALSLSCRTAACLLSQQRVGLWLAPRALLCNRFPALHLLGSRPQCSSGQFFRLG